MNREGQLSGKVRTMFYLGDVNDCQIDINGTDIRVIAEADTYDSLKVGDTVNLDISDYIVYEDDGKDDHNKILT